MGLLSTLFKIGGNLIAPGLGGVIGGSIGGHLDDRQADRRNDRQTEADRLYARGELSRLREDALKAGFHPLEALRAGSGNAGPGSMPRVMSNTAAANNFDLIDDIMSGDAALDRNLKRAELDLLRVEADQARTGSIARAGPRLGVPITDSDIETGRNTNTNPTDVHSGKYSVPWQQDAESAEAADGEVGGLLQGLRNFISRPIYNRTLAKIAAHQGVEPGVLHEKYTRQGEAAYIADRNETFSKLTGGRIEEIEVLEKSGNSLGEVPRNTKTGQIPMRQFPGYSLPEEWRKPKLLSPTQFFN